MISISDELALATKLPGGARRRHRQERTPEDLRYSTGGAWS